MNKDFVTIDLGNTQASYCWFSSEHGIQKFDLDKASWEQVKDLPGILSSVRNEKKLLENYPYLNDDRIFRIGNYFRENHFFDMPVRYSKKLGQDRLACAYWVWKNKSFSKDRCVYVIDAGTFLTFDKISEEGFEGGFIFPGIQTLLSSYTAGENLPSIKAVNWNEGQAEFPKDTKDAILGSIELMYSKSFGSLLQEPSHVYLTGGEAQSIATLLIKNKIEFNLSPYLIHLGLAQCFHAIKEGLE